MTKTDDVLPCPECQAHFHAHPLVIAAAASVGIEHGQSTREMFHNFYDAYHERGHVDPHPQGDP